MSSRGRIYQPLEWCTLSPNALRSEKLSARRIFFRCIFLFGVYAYPAAAQADFYAGAAAGRIHLSSDFAQQVTSAHARDVVPPADIGADATRRIGGRLYGGFSLSRNLAFELDYVTLGEISTRYTTFGDFPITGPGTLTSRSFTTFQHSSKVEGPGVSVIARLPLSESVRILGRAGVVRLRSKSTGQVMTFTGVVNDFGIPDPARAFFVGGAQIDTEIKQNRRVFGLGADFRIADRLLLHAEWGRYFGVGKDVERFTPQGPGKHDIDLMAIGMSFEY